MRVTPPPPSPLEGGAGHSDLERAQDDSAGCDAETSAAQEHHGWLKWGWLMCMEGGGAWIVGMAAGGGGGADYSVRAGHRQIKSFSDLNTSVNTHTPSLIRSPLMPSSVTWPPPSTFPSSTSSRGRSTPHRCGWRCE